MPEITISYDAAHDEPYPHEAIAAISKVVGQHLPVSELTWTRRYDDTPEQDDEQAEGEEYRPCGCDHHGDHGGCGADCECAR